MAAVVAVIQVVALGTENDGRLLVLGGVVLDDATVALLLWAGAAAGTAVLLGATALQRRPRHGKAVVAAGAGLVLLLGLSGLYLLGSVAARGFSAGPLSTAAYVVIGPSPGDRCTVVLGETGSFSDVVETVWVVGPFGVAEPVLRGDAFDSPRTLSSVHHSIAHTTTGTVVEPQFPLYSSTPETFDCAT